MSTVLSAPGVVTSQMVCAFSGRSHKRRVMDEEARLGNSTALFLHRTPNSIMTKCCVFFVCFLFLFCFLGLHPRHMEVARLGIKSEL